MAEEGSHEDDSSEASESDRRGFVVFLFLTNAFGAMGGTPAALLVAFEPALAMAFVSGAFSALFFVGGVATFVVRHYALTRWWASRSRSLSRGGDLRDEARWSRWLYVAALPAPAVVALLLLLARSSYLAAVIHAALSAVAYALYEWRYRRCDSCDDGDDDALVQDPEDVDSEDSDPGAPSASR